MELLATMGAGNKVLYSALYIEKDPFGIFKQTIPIVDPEELQDDGVLIIWGGADIDPGIYGQKEIKQTWANCPERDKAELALANRAMELGIPIIGVCRGAQLMCALSGGSLYQHVDNHQGDHWIKTEEGECLKTNSIHHQMMNPFKVEHRMIAYAETALSERYLTDKGNEEPPTVEPEIVFFPQTNAFCIQGHPEYLRPQNPFVKYCTKKIEEIFYGSVPR